jgi:hypothetical protein
MKYFAVVVLFLLVGCVYAPTITYAPSNNYTSTYAPVYAPTQTPRYVPVYSTRQVYGSPQKIKKVKKYKAVIAGGIAR